jgi:Uma2 family endonuclease
VGSLPEPQDVLLLIEVADTSLPYDRRVKLPLCARASIPEVWIVDLAHEVIEDHTDPSGDRYRSFQQGRRGQTIEYAALPEPAFRVDAMLG